MVLCRHSLMAGHVVGRQALMASGSAGMATIADRMGLN
jgi:hypothetical protein